MQDYNSSASSLTTVHTKKSTTHYCYDGSPSSTCCQTFTNDGHLYYAWSSPSRWEAGRNWKSKTLKRQKNANSVEQRHLAVILILVGSVYASRVMATAMLTHGQIECKGKQWKVTSQAWLFFFHSWMTVDGCKNMGYIPGNDCMHTHNVHKLMPMDSKIHISDEKIASIKFKPMCNFSQIVCHITFNFSVSFIKIIQTQSFWPHASSLLTELLQHTWQQQEAHKCQWMWVSAYCMLLNCDSPSFSTTVTLIIIALLQKMLWCHVQILGILQAQMLIYVTS